MRTCVGCRAKRPQSALVRYAARRVNVAEDGQASEAQRVEVIASRLAYGRGAWICRASDDEGVGIGAIECVETAWAKGGFARAFRTRVQRSS